MAKTRSMGWMPDLPDHRDFVYAAPMMTMRALPAKMDLRKQCPKEVYDQGRLGSCTANAIAGAIEFDQIKQKITQATPSRLFIYYNERAMEHTTPTDSGAQIRDGVKSVNKLGACPETLWTYDDTPPPTDGGNLPELQVLAETAGELLHRGAETSGALLPARPEQPSHDEGLHRQRLSVRIRIHRVQQLSV